MEQELTVEELIALMNDCEGDFMFQIELREGSNEERDSNSK